MPKKYYHQKNDQLQVILSSDVVDHSIHWYIVTVRDVSGWLYLLIGVSVVVTFLLTSRVLDNLGTPVRK